MRVPVLCASGPEALSALGAEVNARLQELGQARLRSRTLRRASVYLPLAPSAAGMHASRSREPVACRLFSQQVFCNFFKDQALRLSGR